MEDWVKETNLCATVPPPPPPRASVGSCVTGSRAPRHTDSPWSWLVCGVSFISLVIISGSNLCFGLLLPPLMDHFQQTRTNIAWVGSLYLTAGSFLSPAISCLIDRVGIRVTAVLGGVLAIIGSFVSSYASWFWSLCITFGLLAGVGARAMYICSTLVVVKYFVKWRSLTVGITTSATSVGMLVMAQIIQALLQSFGWQGVFRGLAALFVLTTLCACLFDPVSSPDGFEEEATTITDRRNYKLCDRSLFNNRDFTIFCASVVLAYLGYYVPSVHMVKHCQQELGIAAKDITMLYTYIAIASFISRHMFCKLGDLDRFNRFHLYQFALTVNGLSLLLCSFARTYNGLVAFFVVYGLMDGGVNGLFPMLVLDCVGQDKFNQAYGFYLFCTAVGTSAGVPLAGLLADELGSYIPSFYTAGGALLCGAVIMFLRTLIPRKGIENTVNVEELLIVEKVTVL